MTAFLSSLFLHCLPTPSYTLARLGAVQFRTHRVSTTVSLRTAVNLSIAIGQLVLLIRRFMAAVRASKRGTTFRELGLRGEILVHQCVFNLRVSERLVTIPAVEIPRCRYASVPTSSGHSTYARHWKIDVPETLELSACIKPFVLSDIGRN